MIDSKFTINREMFDTQNSDITRPMSLFEQCFIIVHYSMKVISSFVVLGYSSFCLVNFIKKLLITAVPALTLKVTALLVCIIIMTLGQTERVINMYNNGVY